MLDFEEIACVYVYASRVSFIFGTDTDNIQIL